VRGHRAFGESGGAAGVEDRGDILVRGVGGGERRGSGSFSPGMQTNLLPESLMT